MSSFQHSFEMPHEVQVDGEWIEVGTINCIVEAEPDEEAGDADWWICEVGIEGLLINEMVKDRPRAKGLSVHWLKKSHPLAEQIKRYAYKHEERALDDLWSRYLADKPRKYARTGSGWALP